MQDANKMHDYTILYHRATAAEVVLRYYDYFIVQEKDPRSATAVVLIVLVLIVLL